MALRDDEIELILGSVADHHAAWPKVEQALLGFLGAATAGFHVFLQVRTKSPSSLRAKLSGRADLSYRGGWMEPPLHDVLGARVLAYVPADLKPLVDAIEHHARSAGLELHKSDRIAKDDGYVAHHIVLAGATAFLETWPVGSPACEVQVVTLASHIWNELNHRVVYKGRGGNPDNAELLAFRLLRLHLRGVEDTIDELVQQGERRRRDKQREVESPEAFRAYLQAWLGEEVDDPDVDWLFAMIRGLAQQPTTVARLDDWLTVPKRKRARRAFRREPAVALWHMLAPRFARPAVIAWMDAHPLTGPLRDAIHDTSG